jgi:hypothetical protein
MSALGHKRTLRHVRTMSALAPKATLDAFFGMSARASSGHRTVSFPNAKQQTQENSQRGPKVSPQLALILIGRKVARNLR